MLAIPIPSHEDDERSIVNSYSVLLRCALLTIVWIVQSYMVLTYIS
jgi:hypothetical protein